MTGRRWLLYLLLIFPVAGCETDTLPVATRIIDPGVIPVKYHLGILAAGKDGFVYGARGNQLFRIQDQGESALPLYTFEDRINAIHSSQPDFIFVATDKDHWNPQTPSRLFRSSDRGESFEQVKSISGGSMLWWSIASDSRGNLFAGEYGPRKPGMSKFLWRSQDNGDTWEVIYRAADREGLHLHRVAVDPYSDDLWLTVGDGKRNRGAYRSRDHGSTWRRELDSQATAVVFAENGIYWGEDHKKTGRVTFFDRETGESVEVLNAGEHGNYGGSIYDMAIGARGTVYVPTMKYPDQDHVISLWAGRGEQWDLLLRHKTEPGIGGGFPTIAGPDQDGWLYIDGYKIRDR